MDFLKDIVKEIGDDYTQLASEAFDYSIAVKYGGNDAALRKKFVEYFDTVFGGVQEIMPEAIDTALALQPDLFPMPLENAGELDQVFL